MTKQTRNIRIKIAEDHKVVIYGLKAMLEHEDQFEFCKDVLHTDQLLNDIESDQPNLLILEVNIGNVNTLSFLPEIKKRFKELKIIFFTDYDTTAIRKEAFRLGAHAFLNKSIDKEELVQTVFNLFEEGIVSTMNEAPVNGNHHSKALDKFLVEELLTERELEVLKLVAKGKTSQQIAEPLFISKHTVQWHRKNIIRKLDLHSASELIRFAFEHGIA